MILIFGTRGMVTSTSNEQVLTQCCPNCKGDLVAKDLKKWFTLFFIPVFPFDTVDSFYRCRSCDSSYKKSAKAALLGASKGAEQVQIDAQRVFAKTLGAIMIHMALIDNDYAKEEEEIINATLNTLPAFKEDAFQTLEAVQKAANRDEISYRLLKEAKECLTSEGIMLLIGQAAKVLLADGKIEKEEEDLLKEYLKICDLPEVFYTLIIDKMQEKTPVMEEA